MLGELLRWVSLIAAAPPLGAASAHLLELPNKLALEGPLWLAVQQQLHGGWGPFVTTFQWAAFIATWLLAVTAIGRFPVFLPTVVAALCVSAGLALSVLTIAPADAAFAGWTAATMPANWSSFRLRWELAQALEFVLAAAGYVALLRAAFRDWCPR